VKDWRECCYESRRLDVCTTGPRQRDAATSEMLRERGRGRSMSATWYRLGSEAGWRDGELKGVATVMG